MLRWGTGSTVYRCADCGRFLESAWQRLPGHPDPLAFTAGRLVWRHRGTRRERCLDGPGVARPA